MTDRISYSTTDEDEATSALKDMFGAELTVRTGDRTGWLLALDSVQFGPLTLTDVRLPSDLGFVVEGRDEVVFPTVAAGTLEYQRGTSSGRYGTGNVTVGNAPGISWGARANHVRAQSVAMPSALFAEVSAVDPDREVRTPEFLDHSPVPGGDRRWRRVTRLVTELLAESDPSPAPLVVGPVARLLAATALEIFPNTAVEPAPADGVRDAHPHTLRRAMEFIEANPDLDLTLLDIARASFVTPRAVQLAFRRHLDTTPMGYLRRVRLHQAHEQLVAASPDDGVTVTRVASRWGFANVGRFAAQYREAYRESPSDTLRR